MLQQQIRHDPDTFPRCRLCGHEPRHIEARGRGSWDPFDPLHPAGVRHALECQCTARTSFQPTLDDALHDWRVRFAIAPRVNVRPLLSMRKHAG